MSMSFLSHCRCVVTLRDVVDRAVLKIKEHDGDAESAVSLPIVGCAGETGSATWMPVVDQRRRQTIERCPDTSPVIDHQHGTVGPAAAACNDMQRYQWSTLNAGYTSGNRRNVRRRFLLSLQHFESSRQIDLLKLIL